MKTIVLLFLTLVLLGCNKNESEYYGYAKKLEDTQVKKIEFSESEKVSQTIQNDDWVTLRSMIDRGLDLNKILDSGRTLLNESVLWNRESIFKNLIQLGADPKIKDKTGLDTHDMCADRINFRILLDPILRDQFQNELLSYLENDDSDELRRMLEQKMNPNFIFSSGQTPLTHAVSNALENCVRTLISTQFETDIHLKDNSGNTALMIARELNLKRIEKLLTGRGALY